MIAAMDLHEDDRSRNVSSEELATSDKLLPLVYDELRMLAARRLAQEKQGQTLQATALVNEAFLKLVKVDRWDSRRHFFAAAADAMRKILVDQARRKSAMKRGGEFERKEFDYCDITAPEKPQQLLAVDQALTELAKANANAAEIVKLRFFAGMTMTEAAKVMGISRRTADRLWSTARAWLAVELGIHET